MGTRDSKVTRNKRKREIIESTNMTYSTMGGIPALGAPRMDQRYEMKQNDWPDLTPGPRYVQQFMPGRDTVLNEISEDGVELVPKRMKIDSKNFCGKNVI